MQDGEAHASNVDVTDVTTADGPSLSGTTQGSAHAPTRPDTDPLLEASRIGRYQILRELGSGGMGVVYAAYDESLNRRVAVKLLVRETSTTAQRLRREAQAMARISDPNVVQIFEVGEHDGKLFVAMEYIEGLSLTRWLAEEHPSWVEIIDVFIRAGRGLQAAHEAGVVHRDFKPDNVMIERSDDAGRGLLRVKVLDFGIASVDLDAADLDAAASGASSPTEPDERLTRAGALMGTPIYMSPEHFLGTAGDPRSDQFSFALALYEALYGQRPFAAETFAQLREAVLAGKLRPAPLLSDVPAWALDTLERALAADPAQRWSSMAELIDVLAHHPDRTADPDLDRTVALSQRLWMMSVLGLGGIGLLGVLVYLRTSASTADLEAFAFWSKLLFSAGTCVALLAIKHVFQKNSYNRRVFALLMTVSLGTLAATICARATGLPVEVADRFVLIVLAAAFGQASASVGRWLIAVPVIALVGLLASFADPFVGPIALGLSLISGVGMTIYTWTRRRRPPAGGHATGRSSVGSGDDLDVTGRF